MPDSTEAITKVSTDSALENLPEVRHVTITPRASDTVTLSDVAKATLLREQGQSIVEIASDLNLSVSEVTNDLQLAAAATQPAAAKT